MVAQNLTACEAGQKEDLGDVLKGHLPCILEEDEEEEEVFDTS